jgi:hypothetical protein
MVRELTKRDLLTLATEAITAFRIILSIDDLSNAYGVIASDTFQ